MPTFLGCGRTFEKIGFQLPEKPYCLNYMTGVNDYCFARIHQLASRSTTVYAGSDLYISEYRDSLA